MESSGGPCRPAAQRLTHPALFPFSMSEGSQTPVLWLWSWGLEESLVLVSPGVSGFMEGSCSALGKRAAH